MEIRTLALEEIPYAERLSRYVFDYSLQVNGVENYDRRFFDEYMNVHNLSKQIMDKTLEIKGAFLNNQLAGVAGMTSQGHITMLYVLPGFARRKIGSRLLEVLKKEAWKKYKLKQITVNAMPGWSAPYFQKNGFLLSNPMQNYMSPFVSLHAESIRETMYETRHLSAKTIVIVFIIFLCLLLTSTFGYMLYFMATH